MIKRDHSQHLSLSPNSYLNKLVQVFQINQDRSLICFLINRHPVDSFLTNPSQDSNLQILNYRINMGKLNNNNFYIKPSQLSKTNMTNNNHEDFWNNKTKFLLLLTRLLRYNKTRFLITHTKLLSHRQRNILNPCKNYTWFNLILKSLLFRIACLHSFNRVPLILITQHKMQTRYLTLNQSKRINLNLSRLSRIILTHTRTLKKRR